MKPVIKSWEFWNALPLSFHFLRLPVLDFPDSLLAVKQFLILFCRVAACLLGGACYLAAAVPSSMVLEVWDSDSGLPHSTVTSIAQTPDGYLWVGMQNGGLARFDGVRFVHFHPGNTPELASADVQTVLVDPAGKLWVGLGDGSLVSYENGVFRADYKLPQVSDGVIAKLVSSGSKETVFATSQGFMVRNSPAATANQRWETKSVPWPDLRDLLCADAEGAFWYCSGEARLRVFKDGSVLFLDDPPGLKSQVIRAIVSDKKGRIWVATEKDIAVWKDDAFVVMTPSGPPLPLNSEIWQLAVGQDDSLWVRTDNEIRKFAEGDWKMTVNLGSKSPFRHSSRNLALHTDSAGGAWVVHYGDGLWHIGADGQVVRFGAAEGLPTGLALCWFEDREGNIWVGLQGGGLVCLRPRVFHEVSLPGEPRVKAASSVCEDGSGAMCFGTVNGFLFRQRGETFERFTPPVEIYGATDLKVFPADGGRLWVASQQNGVVLFEDGKFTYPFPADALGKGPGRARVICPGPDGALWVCSETGLFHWDGSRLTQAEGFDEDKAAQVLSMLDAGDGTLWLGMATGELLQYSDGQLTSHRPDSAKPVKRRESFWTLQAGEKETLWIGTMGGGLLRFRDGNFTRLTVSTGLADESVRQILEDGQGRLWIGTNSGISHANLADLNAYAAGQLAEVPWVSYGRSVGLPTLECLSGIQPSCWRGRDGRLWFTTAKGPVWADPREIRQNRLAPPVVLEQVVVDGRKAGGVLVPKRVLVPPGRHLLEFAFTALSLTEPSKVRFQWQLSGLEDNWVDGGHRRSTSYSFVPPGRYRFQVRACNNDGVWNPLGAAVDLIVRPYYWQAWWFKAGLGGILVLGLVGGTLAVQRRRYRARLRALKQQAAIDHERMRIARDIHDQVGASLTKMGVQAERLAHEPGVAEECQPLVRDVADTTRELLNTMDEIVWTVNPRNDTLENSANYLIHYTREFLRPAGIDYTVDMPLELPNQPLSAELRHNLFMSVKEALSNAVKHGRPSGVRLALDVQPQAWVFTVEDDGCGFSASATAQDEADGLGNMRHRMLAVGGQCEIESAPGKGTRVTLRLPRGETSLA